MIFYKVLLQPLQLVLKKNEIKGWLCGKNTLRNKPLARVAELVDAPD